MTRSPPGKLVRVKIRVRIWVSARVGVRVRG
jgi:hypothetical protein